MAKSLTCRVNGNEISVDHAVQLRDEARRLRQLPPDFRCVDCGEPVRPFRAGGHSPAHIEHIDRNANCPLSHVAPA
jgi:hypothetical protein